MITCTHCGTATAATVGDHSMEECRDALEAELGRRQLQMVEAIARGADVDMGPTDPDEWEMLVLEARRLREKDRGPQRERTASGDGPQKAYQYWKIRPTSGGAWLTIASLDEVGDCDDGNTYELESHWMTDEEADALPEFEGW